MIRTASIFIFLLGFFAACDAPTTGQEIYDGDPETHEELPDEMQEKVYEEREDTVMEVDYD